MYSRTCDFEFRFRRYANTAKYGNAIESGVFPGIIYEQKLIYCKIPPTSKFSLCFPDHSDFRNV